MAGPPPKRENKAAMRKTVPPHRGVASADVIAGSRPNVGVLGLARGEAAAASGVPEDEPSSEGRLIVGEGIQVKGEIQSCRTLIVEGNVEASLEAEELTVESGGIFRGKAKVTTASIDGRFEGELTVEGLLTLHGGGRVSGKLRYRDLKIEQGGRLSGDIDLLEETPSAQAEPRRPETASEDRLLESAVAR